MSKVVNIRASELRKNGFKNFVYWNSSPQNVYIGRANPYIGASASIFANPYKIGDLDRKTVLEMYEKNIRNSPQLLKRIYSLKAKNLGYYCYPEACHGDILIKILNEMVSYTIFSL